MTEDKRMRTLMHRLEAAIHRIEDVADLLPTPGTAVDSNTSTQTVSRIPADSSSLEAPATNVSEHKNVVIDSVSVTDFDTLINTSLLEFMNISDQLGSPVKEQAHIVRETFQLQRDLVHIASLSLKPTTERFAASLVPLQSKLVSLNDIKDKNRPSAFFNHLSAIADGMPAAGWVAITPAPAPFIMEMRDSAQFYGNRVIKEFKDKDVNHVNWTRMFMKVLTELQNYVKTHHTTGLSWNDKGKDFGEVLASLEQNTQNSTGNLDHGSAPGPPPPPPGPPPPPFIGVEEPAPAASAGVMNSVFADLNKGSAVTSGLRKVDKTQMTHKNPALRAGHAASDSKRPAPSAKPAALTRQMSSKKKAPRAELEGTKWIIENYENNPAVSLPAVELNHTVYIYNCKNSTIQIQGKFNALSIDSCAKTGVVVDSLVASIDLIKTTSFALQVMGKCPTIVCDVCDSGQIYLSQEGTDCEIVTSKCGSINLNIPGEDGEFKEEGVPEMLKHKVVNGKLETTIVVHAD